MIIISFFVSIFLPIFLSLSLSFATIVFVRLHHSIHDTLIAILRYITTKTLNKNSTPARRFWLFSEHVWEVQVHRRGLAVEKNIVGTYHLCLTDKALRLSQTGSKTTLTGERRMPYVEFLLTTIRRYVFCWLKYYTILLSLAFFYNFCCC